MTSIIILEKTILSLGKTQTPSVAIVGNNLVFTTNRAYIIQDWVASPQSYHFLFNILIIGSDKTDVIPLQPITHESSTTSDHCRLTTNRNHDDFHMHKTI
jgi:hypothetical protein